MFLSRFYRILGDFPVGLQLKLIVPVILFLFFLFPSFILRITLASLSVILTVNKLTTVKRKYMVGILWSIYLFAFILSPYWIAPRSLEFRIITFVILFLAIPLLSFFSAGELEIHFKFKDIPLLILLGTFLLLVNWIPLQADIPWRGDEDFHINLLMDLGASLNRFTQGQSFQIAIEQLLRYPYLQKWLSLLFVYPTFYKDVALYRAIPFLSTIFLAFFLYQKMKERLHSQFWAFVFSFLFTTIPLVYFYSSLLYLEMPVVLLMTACLFDMVHLVISPWKRLFSRPSWYFLLLISFLKETTLLFLLLVLFLRTIYQLYSFQYRPGKAVISVVLHEIKIWILVFSPVLIYIFFRTFFFDYNLHFLKLDKLFYLSHYWIFFRSLFDQLGAFFFLSLAGFFFLVRKHKWFWLMILLIMVVSNMGFSIADSVGLYNSYIGYSRWNLFLLPIFFYTGYLAVGEFNNYLKVFAAFFLLFSNIYLLPLHLDGTRLPNWGSPTIDTAEYTYPYKEAIRWLSLNIKPKHLLVTGYYYWYGGFSFYFQKYNFYPEISHHLFGQKRFGRETEIALLKKLFKEIEENRLTSELREVEVILYHSVNNISLDENALYGGKFKIVKRIKNSEHSLYIFDRI